MDIGFKVFAVVVLGFLFSLGLMLMDYGASAKGTDGSGMSLVFEKIDPRVMYHEGLLLVLASFLFMTSLVAIELKEKLKCQTC